MAMHVSFAAAAQLDANLYLFDEVLTVGDEHFMRRCTALCDRIVFFDQGQIIGQQECIPETNQRRE